MLFILRLKQCLGLSPIELIHREIDFVDIAYDELSAKHYKEEEVLLLIYLVYLCLEIYRI